jgi:hypothetical protein
MKYRLFTTLVFILISRVLSLSAGEPYKLPDKISREYNRIHVTIVPQVELISIVQTISAYPNVFDFLMAQDSSQYKNDVHRHFEPYERHPVVMMFDRLSLQPRMLNFSAPSNIMLYTNEYLELRADILHDDFVLDRAGGMDSLKVFLSLLEDFAQVSSFNTFFSDHISFYERIISETIHNLGYTNYIEELEYFYGKEQHSYTICLVSLYNHVGFGNSLLHPDNRREIFNTMGPQKVENDIPFYGDKEYIKYMIRHEFSHPFVNPLTEKYRDYIEEHSHKFEEIPEIAKRNVCGEWEECINEFIVRAVTVHLAHLEGEEAGSLAYEHEKSRGVIYLDPLLTSIRIYSDNRSQYPTFDSYYLQLLEIFRE